MIHCMLKYFGCEPGMDTASDGSCSCFANWKTCHRQHTQTSSHNALHRCVPLVAAVTCSTCRSAYMGRDSLFRNTTACVALDAVDCSRPSHSTNTWNLSPGRAYSGVSQTVTLSSTWCHTVDRWGSYWRCVRPTGGQLGPGQWRTDIYTGNSGCRRGHACHSGVHSSRRRRKTTWHRTGIWRAGNRLCPVRWHLRGPKHQQCGRHCLTSWCGCPSSETSSVLSSSTLKQRPLFTWRTNCRTDVASMHAENIFSDGNSL